MTHSEIFNFTSFESNTASQNTHFERRQILKLHNLTCQNLKVNGFEYTYAILAPIYYQFYTTQESTCDNPVFRLEKRFVSSKVHIKGNKLVSNKPQGILSHISVGIMISWSFSFQPPSRQRLYSFATNDCQRELLRTPLLLVFEEFLIFFQFLTGFWIF